MTHAYPAINANGHVELDYLTFKGKMKYSFLCKPLFEAIALMQERHADLFKEPGHDIIVVLSSREENHVTIRFEQLRVYDGVKVIVPLMTIRSDVLGLFSLGIAPPIIPLEILSEKSDVISMVVATPTMYIPTYLFPMGQAARTLFQGLLAEGFTDATNKGNWRKSPGDYKLRRGEHYVLVTVHSVSTS